MKEAAIKVAIYCRLSEEDRNKLNKLDDSQSIQNQKSMLVNYVLENGWEIYNIYSDDDYTGADRNRPEFKRLLADAEARKFDIILCKSQSRFTRELELVEKYIHGLFPIWGIRFIGFADNADTEIKGNKKARQINGLVNEWYLEDLSDNIKTVLTDHRKKGMHIGSFALYGYKKDPEQKGHLIIDDEAADVVREIFYLYAQGVGATRIAQILNERGIPNPTEYKRLKGIKYKEPEQRIGTLWKYYSVIDRLDNEMYIGNMVQGKYKSMSYKTRQNKPCPKEQWIRVENTHEAIIDKELWDKVRKMRAASAKPMCNGKIGIFAGKVQCMYCGYKMRSTKNHEKLYLKCGTRHVSKDACIGSFIPQQKLSEVILEKINSFVKEYLDLEKAEEQIVIKGRLAAREKELYKMLEKEEQKKKELHNALKDLYLDKSRGVITTLDYHSFSKSFHEDIDRCEKIIENVSEKLKVIESSKKEVQSKKSILNNYLDIKELDREIIDIFIDYIEVGKRESVSSSTPVVIHWKI